jgi:hypothetical protein
MRLACLCLSSIKPASSHLASAYSESKSCCGKRSRDVETSALVAKCDANTLN